MRSFWFLKVSKIKVFLKNFFNFLVNSYFTVIFVVFNLSRIDPKYCCVVFKSKNNKSNNKCNNNCKEYSYIGTRVELYKPVKLDNGKIVRFRNNITRLTDDKLSIYNIYDTNNEKI